MIMKMMMMMICNLRPWHTQAGSAALEIHYLLLRQAFSYLPSLFVSSSSGILASSVAGFFIRGFGAIIL